MKTILIHMIKSVYLILIFMSILGCGATAAKGPCNDREKNTMTKETAKDVPLPPLESVVEEATAFALSKIRGSAKEIGDPDAHARYTGPDGRWRTVDAGDWTAGFWSGTLWLAYELSQDKAFRQWATDWTKTLQSQKERTDTHDLGFMIFNSFGQGYRLTSAEDFQEVCLTAASALASRFDPQVGAIKSWDWGEWAKRWPVIIDNMMNLELLFWGAKNGGSPKWYDMAISHAKATTRDHIREDASTIHLVDYDPKTGKVVSQETYSGISDASTWSCGHAWAVYGFVMTYRETKDPQFKETAKRVIDWYLQNLPDDGVPYWDFDAPKDDDPNNDYRDVAAGAIALSGLLEWITLLGNSPEAADYWKSAQSILRSLATDYLTQGTSSRGILQHGYGDDPANETDVSLIYADYYFLESILRYRKIRH